MLKNISPLISPDLMKLLMEMGHGDELILADGNFPSNSQGVPVVRADGHNVANLLEAILEYFPLDTYTEHPFGLMQVVEGDPVVPKVWDQYKEILKANEYSELKIEYVERFAFYERAKKVAGIVATSDKAIYGNVLIRKGVV